MSFKIIISFFVIFNLQLQAKDVEGFFGASYTKYKLISSDYDQYGASARMKYNSYKSGDSGFTAFAMWNGHNVFMGDFMVGYGVKTSGSVYFEAAGYGAFSMIWGLGFAFLGGVGFDLGSNYYLSIPVLYRFPSYLGINPMFGYRF